MNRQKKEELKRAQQQRGVGHQQDGDQHSSREGRKIGKANNSKVAVRVNQPVINSGRPTPNRGWFNVL